MHSKLMPGIGLKYWQLPEILLKGRSIPRWIILLLDQGIAIWSFSLSYFIVKQFQFPWILRGHFFVYTGSYFLVCVSVFFFMHIHTGLIRYSNSQDIVRIFFAVVITSLLYPVATDFLIGPVFLIRSLNVTSVLLVNFFMTTCLLIMVRIVVKSVYFYIRRAGNGSKKRVLIYGSGWKAMVVKQAIEGCMNGSFVVAGFADLNPRKVNHCIQQKKVYDIKDLADLKDRLRIEKLVLINEQTGAADKKLLLERCLRIGLQVLTVPPAEQWISGKLQQGQIRNLNIEDLLQRPPIVIDTCIISRELTGKRVLVTGAAGSIGSEIVKQIMHYNPELVILCDQAESPLHEIQLEMEDQYPKSAIRPYIADINNFNRMYDMFYEYRPEYIFHAAAYKHVPMMERNPSEAINTNILGTKNIADLAVLFDARKFVMISTDKAVNPTNVMGASKRIAEIYIQALNNYNGTMLEFRNTEAGFYKAKILTEKRTHFVTTRFGNVLGSNGSVIPRFRAQIEEGRPVTVTHPEIMRYFMTIPEAVELVLEAGCVGEGGEIFVFDMGEPVKIVDLAREMIRLAGMEPDVDIPIIFTGLRPGEKLYEELLNEKEKTLPTHHEKIRIARVIMYPYQEILESIGELLVLNKKSDELGAVRKMKEIVPEFRSKNSKFAALDQDGNCMKEITQIDI